MVSALEGVDEVDAAACDDILGCKRKGLATMERSKEKKKAPSQIFSPLSGETQARIDRIQASTDKAGLESPRATSICHYIPELSQAADT